jgi:hypothetical protein
MRLSAAEKDLGKRAVCPKCKATIFIERPACSTQDDELPTMPPRAVTNEELKRDTLLPHPPFRRLSPYFLELRGLSERLRSPTNVGILSLIWWIGGVAYFKVASHVGWFWVLLHYAALTIATKSACEIVGRKWWPTRSLKWSLFPVVAVLIVYAQFDSYKHVWVEVDSCGKEKGYQFDGYPSSHNLEGRLYTEFEDFHWRWGDVIFSREITIYDSHDSPYHANGPMTAT